MKSIRSISFALFLVFAAGPCLAQNAATLHIGIEASTLKVGIEPSTLYAGLELANLYVGVEPSTLYMGTEPSRLHMGIEPANLYIGTEPSIFDGPSGRIGAEASFLEALLWMPGRPQSWCSFNKRARFSACERASLNMTSTLSSVKTPISGE